MHNCGRFFLILVALFPVLGTLNAEPYTFDPPVQISVSGQSAGGAEVAVTPAGNAIAVWSRSDGFNGRIQGAQFTLATESWTAPITLSAAGVTATSPAICSDPNGNAIAVWRETGGALRSARYNAATQVWSAPILIATGIATSAPEVSCDPNGNAVAVWTSFIMGSLIAQASYFDVGLMTWSAPTLISLGGASATDPQVSVDSTGDAVAVWRRSGVIQSSTFDGGTLTWSAPITISSGGSTVADPQVGTDAAGSAIAVWERSAPSVDIRAARFTKGGGWAAPVSIVAPAIVNRNPILAVNDSLQAIAVWEGFDGANVTIQASSFDPTGNTWSAVQDVDPGMVTLDTDVAIDNNGNGVAVFERFVPPQEAFASSFDLETNTWSTPEMISSPGENVDNPQVQVASTGVAAIAVFTGDDGATGVIEASTGIGSGLLAPPTAGVGKRIKNRFPFQKEYFNELKWVPSTSSLTVGYKISRNGELITTLSSRSRSEYRDHNRSKNGTDVYEIRAIDSLGGESAPATIIVN